VLLLLLLLLLLFSMFIDTHVNNNNNNNNNDDNEVADEGISSKRKPSTRTLEPIHLSTLHNILTQQQLNLSLTKLIEAVVAALPEGVLPPTKKALSVAIRNAADWNGRTWVLKSTPTATATTPDEHVAVSSPTPMPLKPKAPTQKTLFDVVKSPVQPQLLMEDVCVEGSKDHVHSE
jgi:hypothetical protein